jgi:enterochelin esterase-like enzyme
VERHRLRSEFLAPCRWLDPPRRDTRRVWVYTPPGYTPNGEPYRLLLLFDGYDYLHYLHAPTILDNLIAEGHIPPLVAVLFDSPNEVRRELGASPFFVECLARDLIPWARQNYHITTDPARAIVGGFSLGGFAAAFAALCHPELFGNVLSQSGAFWWNLAYEPEEVQHLQEALQRLGYDSGSADGQFGPKTVDALRAFQKDRGLAVERADVGGIGPETEQALHEALGSQWKLTPIVDREHEWLARQFAASPTLPLRFYLNVGRFETYPSPNHGPSQLVNNRHLRNVLLAKGYPFYYAEFCGAHSFLWWQSTLADGLLALIGNQERM